MNSTPHLVLVGYRASGKSTIAKRLARAMGWPWRDLDAFIVERAGCPIATIFERDGEAAFRDQEEHCLAELLTHSTPLIIATGGGAITRLASRQRLCEIGESGGRVIYLQATAQALASRLQHSRAGVRPSLTGRPIAEEVAEVLAQREPWYQEVATHVISVQQPISQVMAAIKAIITTP